MRILEIVNYYMNVILFATILIVAILAALFIYLVKVKKITAKEERINYSNFNRESTMEYCKFDDLVADPDMRNMSGAGMFVINEYSFVTGIDIVGYNYSHASAGEQQNTIINAIAFANIIEQPIQMRQNVKAMEIQASIDQFIQVREEAIKELTQLNETYSDLLLQAESRRDDPEVLEAIMNNIETLNHKIFSTEWKVKEADNITGYEKMLQKHSSIRDKSNQILFYYTYNPNDYIEELSREEIQIKAMTALKTKIGIYSNALRNCGCSCKPLDADTLAKLVWRHLHPNTADMVNVKDWINTEMSTLYVTSDSLYELERERIGEEAVLNLQNRNEQYYEEQLQQAEEAREKEVYTIREQVAKMGERIRREEGLS